MNYLLLVEGKKTEVNIFNEVLQNYGFNVIVENQLKKYEDIELSIKKLTNSGSNNVIICQAPRNRLNDLMNYYKRDMVDLDKMFGNNTNYFNGIFLIFDVDHTSNENLKEIFSIHNEETKNGLLLVSSPCIEIMSEPNRTKELITDHIRKYKHERNSYFCDELKINHGTEGYIINNFDELALRFLDKNYKEFGNENIMEHPYLVIDKINDENIRKEEEVIYNYFTTVVYVAIAFIHGLTKQIDNYKDVRDFFLKKMRSKL